MVSSRARFIGYAIGAMALISCGVGDGGGSTTPSTPAAPTTTTEATTTTERPPTTTTERPPTTTTETSVLPGEPIELGPVQGDVVAVVGVAHNDVLNLRQAPGADQEILAEIPPLFDSLAALGESRQLTSSIWVAVDYQGTEGWVNLRYIAYLGATTDALEPVLLDLGTSPAAETIEGLGSIVIETFSSEDLFSEVVLVGTQVTESMGEVTYDVVGSEDDSVRGVRVRVEGTPYGGGFTLHDVTTTVLCARGVTDDGLCI